MPRTNSAFNDNILRLIFFQKNDLLKKKSFNSSSPPILCPCTRGSERLKPLVAVMHQSTFTPREDLSRQGTSNGGDMRRGHPVFSVSCGRLPPGGFCLVCLSQTRPVTCRPLPTALPLLHPPAVLSPSSQDNLRFKHSLSHLDLDGYFAADFLFIFFLNRDARRMDGGINWTDGFGAEGCTGWCQ